MTELNLEVSRSFSVSPEKLYNAWLNPKILAKFMLPGEHMSCPFVETNPVVGGRFRVVMASPEQEIPHGGEYLELSPFQRIVFTWESPFSIAGSTVTLDFEKEAEGTLLKLHHVKFPEIGRAHV